MSRLPWAFFVACVLSMVPMLIACDPGTPATPPDPVQILKQANAAAAKLTSLSYQARFYGEGAIASQLPNVDGQVAAKRSPAGQPQRFRIEGNAAEPGAYQKSPFALACDGANLYSVEHARRLYASGPLESGLSVNQSLFPAKYLLDAPFDEEIKNGALEYRGVQDVDGVACDVIDFANVGARPPQKTKIFLGKKDCFLRRAEITIQGMAPAGAGATAAEGRVIFTVSNFVANPELKDAGFRLECPNGFQKQPLQTNRPPQGPGPQGSSPAVGTPAPDWELKSSDGKTIALKNLRGKVVVMDFWATWCGPCKMAMPGIQKLRERFKDKAVTVFGVDCRERTPNAGAAAMAYIKEKGYTYTQLLNGDSAADAYKVNGIPCIFVIDPDGKILYNVAGFDPGMEETLAGIIEKALKK